MGPPKGMSTYTDMTLIHLALIVQRPTHGQLGISRRTFMPTMKHRVHRHSTPSTNSKVDLSIPGVAWLVSSRAL
jgi:hypothetical protein